MCVSVHNRENSFSWNRHNLIFKNLIVQCAVEKCESIDGIDCLENVIFRHRFLLWGWSVGKWLNRQAGNEHLQRFRHNEDRILKDSWHKFLARTMHPTLKSMSLGLSEVCRISNQKFPLLKLIFNHPYV